MKIKSIHIKNFKSIFDQKLFLKDINLLIGPNGVGKTNFIMFFKLLNKIIEKQLQSYVVEQGGGDNIFHFGKKVSDEIFFDISFGENDYYATIRPSENDEVYFHEERIVWYNPENNPYTYSIGNGNYETKLYKRIEEDEEKKAAWYVTNALKSWRVYHFHDTSPNSLMKQTNEVDDNKFLRSDASNLASFLYLLSKKHVDAFCNIENTIKIIAPFFDKFSLEPLSLNESKIKLEWKHIGTDKYFNGSHLSDGTLRMICLIVLLLQPKPPNTIIIDEPELGLHPAAIQLLSALIKSASIKSQIICSTQSVNLIDEFQPEDIIVVDRKNNQSVFNRLESEKLSNWLEEYSLGELWEKNILGGRP